MLSNRRCETLNDNLQHHGIKGQKWGVRRYQNKDGGLTDAGKKRYRDYDFNDATNKIKDISDNRRSNLKERYKQDGLSDKDAEAAARRRVKGEQYVAGFLAVNVAALVPPVTIGALYTGYKLTANTYKNKKESKKEND